MFSLNLISHILAFALECIKGKLTIKAKKGKNLLELIHTNLCGPLSPNTMERFKYFITFIDNHSRFGWVKLLTKKSNALDAFEKFKTVIELKLEKQIKCVHSNKGGEYYDRYNETGRNPDPFVRY